MSQRTTTLSASLMQVSIKTKLLVASCHDSVLCEAVHSWLHIMAYAEPYHSQTPIRGYGCSHFKLRALFVAVSPALSSMFLMTNEHAARLLSLLSNLGEVDIMQTIAAMNTAQLP